MACEQHQPPVGLQLRLEDVYEIATRVSEEFQLLASQFGGTRLSTIVTLVLDALEQLESVVTANQQLEIKVRKLILGNDALMREKEETSTGLKEYSQLKEEFKDEKRERKRLTEEVGRLRKRNESLIRRMDQMKLETEVPQLLSLQTVAEESELRMNGSDNSSLNFPNGGGLSGSRRTPSPNGADDIVDDVMATVRVNKRLMMVESELDLTKHRLITTQTSLQSVTSENNSLKLQLEQCKAELSLMTIEASKMSHSCSNISSTRDDELQSPKFYKDDLLRVLKERNELKEEMDSLRDELSLTQAELRKCQSTSRGFRRQSRSRTPPARQRSSTTRVREIFDSIRIEEYDIISKA